MAINYYSEMNERSRNPFALLEPSYFRNGGTWEFGVSMRGYETEEDARRAWAFARKTSDDTLVTGTASAQRENGQGFVQHGLSKVRMYHAREGRLKELATLEPETDPPGESDGRADEAQAPDRAERPCLEAVQIMADYHYMKDQGLPDDFVLELLKLIG
jgi:hypothetical protein